MPQPSKKTEPIINSTLQDFLFLYLQVLTPLSDTKLTAKTNRHSSTSFCSAQESVIRFIMLTSQLTVCTLYHLWGIRSLNCIFCGITSFHRLYKKTRKFSANKSRWKIKRSFGEGLELESTDLIYSHFSLCNKISAPILQCGTGCEVVCWEKLHMTSICIHTDSHGQQPLELFNFSHPKPGFKSFPKVTFSIRNIMKFISRGKKRTSSRLVILRKLKSSNSKFKYISEILKKSRRPE